eukprot:CAMPEP_0183311218 /NCGR_PEP_ID=MMETSP0160_2-20130417/35782_1 /TAXON_ID=2839 ORGANISM="Odontella Sinensis, Strain Grunow 1884" /NCGR_SAMPLE_ID=MMETSP0160_2 /ASSEMBLY_ACC=CAM_ASM_000250 /LENGTH=107 /DNA_ID=CAMNT_0025475729 /DNA_START=115 /DNA_END=435 /DNA_ORIENTATION=+
MTNKEMEIIHVRQKVAAAGYGIIKGKHRSQVLSKELGQLSLKHMRQLHRELMVMHEVNNCIQQIKELRRRCSCLSRETENLTALAMAASSDEKELFDAILVKKHFLT